MFVLLYMGKSTEVLEVYRAKDDIAIVYDSVQSFLRYAKLAKEQIREAIETFEQNSALYSRSTLYRSTKCRIIYQMMSMSVFKKMSSSLRYCLGIDVGEKYARNLNVWPVSCRNDTLVF